jgi:hypothetical protein
MIVSARARFGSKTVEFTSSADIAAVDEALCQSVTTITLRVPHFEQRKRAVGDQLDGFEERYLLG